MAALVASFLGIQVFFIFTCRNTISVPLANKLNLVILQLKIVIQSVLPITISTVQFLKGDFGC